ncbi:sugar ABC transporter substrate-binding protein [Candidatus Thalassolituus haligoni]|uniref:ABC transporter substrate-binding protein n=1 Tax=Candidatus Thalassolituus haligoni TaxID=3100113 RepID=UPI003517D5FE
MPFKLATAVLSAMMALSFAAQAATELVIATVNNGHMIEMQKLTPQFEKANPDIKVKWVTLEESVLRQRITTDIATRNGQFDVMTIGMYEAPIWGERGWLKTLEFGPEYDVDDLLPAIRSSLSNNGKLVAAPFYGESSMLMYRADLVEKAGLNIPPRPTWNYIAKVAAAIHDENNGVYGICLRGKPGWGDNVALLTTMVNTWGGQWFDMDWKPQLDTQPWHDAISFYVDLMKRYGPPDSSANSFNEILALFNEGKCGMWVDATIAASFISDPALSRVADKVAYAQAPTQLTPKGSHWLWAWALAIPVSARHQDEALRFISWATSREYINLVGQDTGWARVPTGTRYSTYENEQFIKAATFADAELQAISSANSENSTLHPSPYIGIQFAAIPEFQTIGIVVGQQISAALVGKRSVEDALRASQSFADREMRKGRYY